MLIHRIRYFPRSSWRGLNVSDGLQGRNTNSNIPLSYRNVRNNVTVAAHTGYPSNHWHLRPLSFRKQVKHLELLTSTSGLKCLSTYSDAYHKSLTKPDEFWGEAADHLEWFKRWNQVLDNDDQPFTKW